MSDFVRKKKKQRILYSRPILLALVVAVIFVAKGAWGIYKKERDTRENFRAALMELENAKNRESVLKNQLEKLNTESGVEKEIRDRFNVVKEGENVAIIVEPQKEDLKNKNEDERSGFWSWIKDIFK